MVMDIVMYGNKGKRFAVFAPREGGLGMCNCSFN